MLNPFEFQKLFEKTIKPAIQKTFSGTLGNYEAFEPVLIYLRNYNHVLSEQQVKQLRNDVFNDLFHHKEQIPNHTKPYCDLNAKEKKEKNKLGSIATLSFYFRYFGWLSELDYDAAARNMDIGIEANSKSNVPETARLSLVQRAMMEMLNEFHPNRVDSTNYFNSTKQLSKNLALRRGRELGCIYSHLVSIQFAANNSAQLLNSDLNTLEKLKRKWSGDIKISLGYYLQGVTDFAKYKDTKLKPAAAIKSLNKIFEWMEKALAVEQLPESHHLMVYLYWELAEQEAAKEGTAVNYAKYDAQVLEHIAQAISNGSSFGMLALAEYMRKRCNPQSDCYDTHVGGALALAQRSRRVPVPFFDGSTSLRFNATALGYNQRWLANYDDSQQYEHQPNLIRAAVEYLLLCESGYRDEPFFTHLLNRLASISPEIQQLISSNRQQSAAEAAAFAVAVDKNGLMGAVKLLQSGVLFGSNTDYDPANASTSSTSSASSSGSPGSSPQSTPPQAASGSFFNQVQYPPVVQPSATMPRASAPPTTNPMPLPKAPQHPQYLPHPSAPQMTSPMPLPTVPRASAPQMTNPMQLPTLRPSAPQMTNPMQLPRQSSASPAFHQPATVRGSLRDDSQPRPPAMNPEYASTSSVLPNRNSDYAELVDQGAGFYSYNQ